MRFPMNIPWQIWIVVFLLGLEAIGNVLMIPAYPQAIIWLAAKIVIITGLLCRWKAVFILSLFLSLHHAIFFAVHQQLGVAFTNFLLFVLTVTTWNWFFKKDVNESVL